MYDPAQFNTDPPGPNTIVLDMFFYTGEKEEARMQQFLQWATHGTWRTSTFQPNVKSNERKSHKKNKVFG